MLGAVTRDEVLMFSTATILAALALRSLRAGKAADHAPLRLVDMTGAAELRPAAARHTRKRDPSGVYAAVLHQMGFSRGSDPTRYLGVTAHYAVLPDGTVLQLHPHSTRLPHGNGLNTGSVGIEFAGNFPSVRGGWWYPEGYEGDPRYENLPTPEQLEAGRALLRMLRDKYGFTHVLAHRQSSATRGNDPGPHVWGAVGEWAKANLGMSDGGPEFAVGNGNPIDERWARAPYYNPSGGALA
jgi:hypothetical protein